MSLSQGQYGGTQAPAVTSPGGSAMLSNLASGALGMLTGGGSMAIDAAMKAAGDSSTTVQQPSATTGPQSTGSKVFNLTSAGGAMNNNNFWQAMTGATGNTSFLVPLVLVLGLLGLGLIFLLRRK